MQRLAERVMPTASLFFCTNARTHLMITLSGNPKAINLGGAGAGPRMKPQALQLLDMNGITGGQTPPDSIQLAVTALFVAQILAPLGRRVLACKHRGSLQIHPGLDQMVQDLDPILRIPADREIINEQNLNPGVVSQLLPILVQIAAAAQNEQFIQQVTVVDIHAAVIPAAGLVAERGHKIGFSRLCNAVDADIQTFLNETEG